MWVLPGVHRRGTVAHRNTQIGYQCCEDPDGAVPVPVKAGDVVVFGGNIAAMPETLGELRCLPLAARELGVKRVVHTSTSEVYGTARRVPIDEEHPLQGQSPYSATKIGADQLADFATWKQPERVLELYSKLREASRVDIEMERNGKPLKKTYSVR